MIPYMTSPITDSGAICLWHVGRLAPTVLNSIVKQLYTAKNNYTVKLRKYALDLRPFQAGSYFQGEFKNGEWGGGGIIWMELFAFQN